MTTIIRLDVWARILEFCEETIGRKPSTMVFSAETVELVFDPSLTPTEKTALNNAMPDFEKKLFKVTMSEV